MPLLAVLLLIFVAVAPLSFAASQAPVVGDELLRDTEVAARLKLCRRQIHKLAADGRLPAPIRLGRSIRWRLSDVLAAIASAAPAQPASGQERR